MGKRVYFFTAFLTLVILLSCTKYRNNNSIFKTTNSLPSKLGDSIDLNRLNNNRYHDSLLKEFQQASPKRQEDLASQLTLVYYKKDDSLEFRKWNNASGKLALKLNDIPAEAKSHWNLGNFFYKYSVLDSAYFHFYRAKELYVLNKNQEKEAILLLNMAILQNRVKDFIGSEVTSIQALKIFKKLNNNKDNLYRIYNHLGIVSNGLGNYNQSLKFLSQAEKVGKELQNSIFEARSLNNKGVVYLDMKSYNEAQKLFHEALVIPGLKLTNPRLYAMSLDNYAYASWKSGKVEGISSLFEEAYRIRDSIGHTPGKIVNQIHFGEFSYNIGQKSSGIQQLKDAKKLSEKTENYEYLLESLLLLSEMDSINGNNYLSNYIKINDSLVTEERKVQNKFARIRYETDEYIQVSENLSEQKFWIIIFSVSLFAIILLIYFLREQRIKNKELLFDREQQVANERIYQLLLSQQAKLEEGRNQERIRISEELHDGILGELFGTRMGLGILDLSLSDASSLKFKKLINNLKNIEKDIRQVSHELRNNLLSDKFNNESDFVNILDEYLNKISRNQSFKVIFNYDKDIEWALIDDNTKIHLYRIVQEALHNIIKHSEASIVNMEITYNENILSIKIQDNGKGFKIGKAKAGIGLKNIRSRAKKINADLKIVSENGTLIILKIFLDYEK